MLEQMALALWVPWLCFCCPELFQPSASTVRLLIQQIFMEHLLGAQQHDGKQESPLQSLLVRVYLDTRATVLSTHGQNQVWEPTIIILKERGAEAGKCYRWREIFLGTIPLAVI